MRVAGFIAALAVGAGLASAGWASPGTFDAWIQSLSHNGWRLVAISDSQKSALLIGADTQDPAGRRIVNVRYEFMRAVGGWAGVVAQDTVDCKAATISRQKVTGYTGNNLGGRSVEEKVDAKAMSAVPLSYQQEEVHYACGMGVTLKIAASSSDPMKKADDPNQVICRTEAVVGSGLPVRVCETKQQAADRRMMAQEATENTQHRFGNSH